MKYILWALVETDDPETLKEAGLLETALNCTVIDGHVAPCRTEPWRDDDSDTTAKPAA